MKGTITTLPSSQAPRGRGLKPTHGLCLLLAWWALATCSGCALLVSDDPIRCLATPGQADPCPQGRVCVSGYCVPTPACSPSAELCNGIDDDCDGKIDNGHDDDGDGFTWCGGGLVEEVDCDDSRADVHPASQDGTRPAAPELCDSRDNDCDQRVDEDPETLCGGGEHCFAGLGCALPDCTLRGFECDAGDSCDVSQTPPVCIAGVCSPTSCPTPRVCDPVSGSCVDRLPLDSACAVSAQCADGTCVAARALSGVTGSVCALACCRDSECPSGRVCWASPRGGRACVLPSSIGSALGSAVLGAGCAASAECASARCLDGVCREACVSPDDCTADATCALLPSNDIAPPKALACVPDTHGVEVGASCERASCASNLCAYRVETGGSICLGGCHTSEDCPSDMYCGSVTLDGSSGAGTNVQVCEPRIHPGGGVSGDACATGWSCRDLGCIGGRCADTCCHDADCPTDFACVPVNRGSAVYEMRCLAR